MKFFPLWNAQKILQATVCVPSNFMANQRMPKFSSNNCAQSSKKTFLCPKGRPNPVSKYTQCHISTNLSNFLKLCLLYCQKLLALAPTNRRFAEKNRLSGNAYRTTLPVLCYKRQLHLLLPSCKNKLLCIIVGLM